MDANEPMSKLIKITHRLMMRNRSLMQIEARRRLEELREKHTEPKSLVPHGYSVYSQNDEDGMIREIFKRIGVTNRAFVEIGIGNGLTNNTLALLFDGWKGLWIDCSDAMNVVADRFGAVIDSGALHLIKSRVTKENVDSLIAMKAKGEIDLLSLDIDGNDFHVLSAIRGIKPRVMVLEYNAKFPPPMAYCMKYDENHAWDGTDKFGASLKWLETRLDERGYALVGCSVVGVNAFFVRKDLVGKHFLEPFTAEKHYQPPRYELVALGSGHKPSYSTLVDRVK